ncbi:MAG: hypothetical protein Q8L72_10390 [Moraxellaceae bacterium]|nr:hypothetical protein [Moraxellaceae bacterium]
MKYFIGELEQIIVSGCHPTIAQSIFSFARKVTKDHTATYGNHRSIFPLLQEIEDEFLAYLRRTGLSYCEDLAKTFSLTEIGREETRRAHQGYFDSDIYIVTHKEVLKAEDHVRSALELLLERDPYIYFYSQVEATLETIISLLHFVSYRKPKQALIYLRDENGTVLRKDRTDRHTFLTDNGTQTKTLCKHCGNFARHNPMTGQPRVGLLPTVCIRHNQKRSEILSFLGITDTRPSEYRFARRHQKSFEANLLRIRICLNGIVRWRGWLPVENIMAQRKLAYLFTKDPSQNFLAKVDISGPKSIEEFKEKFCMPTCMPNHKNKHRLLFKIK